MKDRILIILPTKNRPKLFEAHAQSYLETTEGLSDVLVLLDEGDTSYEELKQKYPQFIWRTMAPEKPIKLMNKAAITHCYDYRWLCFMEDDIKYVTPKWESTFIAKLKELGRNAIVNPLDRINGKNKTVSIPFMDSSIVRRLGFMAPLGLSCHYPDNYWSSLAEDLGTWHYFEDFIMEHNHPSRSDTPVDDVYLDQQKYTDDDRACFYDHVFKHFNNDIKRLKRKSLVLGGGGFIGGALAARLKGIGEWVRVVDMKENPYRRNKDISDEYILGDLRNENVVREVITQDIDYIYQLAADMGGAGFVFTGINDAAIMYNSAKINLNIAHRAQEIGAKMLFFSSSACTYPKQIQTDPLHSLLPEEAAYPANPDSDYGWEKLFSERLYLAFRKNWDLNVKIARFHNIYGPYGTYKGGREKVVNAIFRKILEAKDGIEMWGSGEQTRTFLYVEDCVDAILALTEHPTFFGPVNIGSTELISIKNLTKMGLSIAGKPDLPIRWIEGPVGVMGRCSDNTLIESKLGWRQATPLLDGMTKTYKWLREVI